MPRSEPHKVEPLSPDAVLSLIDAVPDRLRGLAVLCAGCGLRPGEALCATLDEVDFLRRTFTVRHQLSTVSGERPQMAPLKTKSSARTVPMPEVVIKALVWHLERFEPGKFGLLFTTDDGSPIARNAFTEMWRRTTKVAKLPATVRAHDLRHFCASALIRRGPSVKTVQNNARP